MSDKNKDKIITDSINKITEKLSDVFLKEFIQLPPDIQLSIVLIKSSQLLLANVLCQVASDKSELEGLIENQGADIKELTMICAETGFSDKFGSHKH